MKSLILFCFLLLVAAAWLVGCVNSTSINIQGMTYPIKGSVSVFDTSVTTPRQLRSMQGIQVQMEATGFIAATDTNGEWQWDNVPDGFYDITFSKAGYGVHQLYQ